MANARVGVFVDVNDQFFRVQNKWEGRKIDYRKYYEKCESYGSVMRAFAYGTHVDNKAINFIKQLYKIGFETKYKNNDPGEWYSWVIGMSIDMMILAGNDRVDTVIIGSSNFEFIPIIGFIRNKGIRVIVMACNINRDLRKAADQWLEIYEDMLEETKEPTIIEE
jgi:uncharacterized LabA/DUF88 family protein